MSIDSNTKLSLLEAAANDLASKLFSLLKKRDLNLVVAKYDTELTDLGTRIAALESEVAILRKNLGLPTYTPAANFIVRLLTLLGITGPVTEVSAIAEVILGAAGNVTALTTVTAVAIVEATINIIYGSGSTLGTTTASGAASIFERTLLLDARSPNLLATPQPFPTTAADLLVALGSPAGWTDANVLHIYLLNTAVPMLDQLGGPSWGGTGLTARECCGIPDSSFFSKYGCETTVSPSYLYFAPNSGGGSWLTVNANTLGFLAVVRIPTASPSDRSFLSHFQGGAGEVGWRIQASSSSGHRLLVRTTLGGTFTASAGGYNAIDGAWHCVACYFNGTTRGMRIFTDVGDSAEVTWTAGTSIYNALDTARIGSILTTDFAPAQLCYLAVFDAQPTSAMRAAFWRSILANSDLLGTDNTHTRSNPLVVPISSSRVACYAANQPAIGYDANAVAADNPLGTGLVANEAASFLGIGSNNLMGWGATNLTATATDGSSGMRDAVRLVDSSGAAAGYLTSGGVSITGATNVDWRFGFQAQKVLGGGTNAVVQIYFSGDGGGPETLTVAALEGTVPVAWTRFGGIVTPTRTAHTTVNMRLLPTDGVLTSTGTVDFAEPWGIQNRSADISAWRRTATNVASNTSTPVTSYINSNNSRYSPTRGELVLRISNFESTNGSVFLSFGTAGTAGSLVLDYSSSNLRLRLWDEYGALVDTLNCGSIDTAKHEYTIAWNATNGTISVSENGSPLDSYSGAPWTPEHLSVTPLYIGSDGTSAARCLVSLVSMSGEIPLPVAANIELDARSNTLITAGNYQVALPTTDAELVAQGWPSIAGATDGELWLCDEASGNLVGEIRGYQLAPQNSPLHNRDFHGLPYGGSLWGKKAVGTAAQGSTSRFESVSSSYLDISSHPFTISFVVRFPDVITATNATLFRKHTYAPPWGGYGLDWSGANSLRLFTTSTTPLLFKVWTFSVIPDTSACLITFSYNRSTAPVMYINNSVTATGSGSAPGAESLSNASTACLLGTVSASLSLNAHVAWAYINIGNAANRTGHDALWAALSSSKLGTANTYARANPLTYSISASRVATASDGMLPVGYDSALSAGDNTLGTGFVSNDGASFLGLGSTNVTAYTGTNATVTAADGPSGMRDSARVADASGAAGYASSGSATLTGATNVAHRFGMRCQQVAAGGTNALLQAYFSGDGGGPETLTVTTLAGTVPATWEAFSGTVTPTRAAHTAVVMRFLPTDGVGASTGTVDFAEPWGVQNRSTDVTAWRRTAAGAASSISAQTTSYTNVSNARYNPASGKIELRLSGLSSSIGSTQSITLAGGPDNLCFDGTNMWVPQYYNNSVIKINAWSRSVVGTYSVGNAPSAACFDGTNIWVTSGGSGSVTKLLASSGSVVGTYATQAWPIGMCFDGTYIWTANYTGDSTTKLLASTGQLIGHYPAGNGPSYCCFDGTYVWFTNFDGGTITKILASDGSLIGTYPVGYSNPHGIAFDDTYIWVCASSHVLKINPANGAVVTDYDIVSASLLRGLWIEDQRICVASYNSPYRVWGINKNTGQIDFGITVGSGPVGIASDGRNLWISQFGGNIAILPVDTATFVQCGTIGAAGSLVLDYARTQQIINPRSNGPQLCLRLWDDNGILVDTLNCGSIDSLLHNYSVEWDAAAGTISVSENESVLDSYSGAAWTPEATDVTPLYIGNNNAGTSPSSYLIDLAKIY